MSSFSQFTNQYELSKTLRFELKPSKENNFIEGDEQKLLEDFWKIQEFFIDIFVYESEKEFDEERKRTQYKKIELRKKREIHYDWLRKYTKNAFYEQTSGMKKSYEINSFLYLSKECLRWINEWIELCNDLETYINAPEEKQKRRSEIAQTLRAFSKRENFLFIKDFFFAVRDVQNKKNTESDTKIHQIRKEFEEIQLNFENCKKKFLPSQSSGVVLYKSTLNYYTLNKSEKEYAKLEEELKKQLYEKKIKDFKTEKGKVKFWFDKTFEFGENPLYWNLNEAYLKIKEWKAEQKSRFTEAVQKKQLTKNNFSTKFPLFDASDNDFLKFYDLTRQLDDRNQKNKKEIAQERGEFFNSPRKRVL